MKDLLAVKQGELDALAAEYQALLDSWEKFQTASNELTALLAESTIPLKEIAKLFDTKMPVLQWITKNFTPTPQEENPLQP